MENKWSKDELTLALAFYSFCDIKKINDKKITEIFTKDFNDFLSSKRNSNSINLRWGNFKAIDKNFEGQKGMSGISEEAKNVFIEYTNPQFFEKLKNLFVKFVTKYQTSGIYPSIQQIHDSRALVFRNVETLKDEFYFDETIVRSLLDKFSENENLENSFEKEKFKLAAFSEFSKHWDINTHDFVIMLRKSLSKTGTLLTSHQNLAQATITGLAEREPEELRNLFLELFDENNPLEDRIANFRENIRLINDKYKAKPEHSDFHQNGRAISVYLALRYPEKYFLYKYSECNNFLKRIKANPGISGKRISLENKMILYSNYMKKILIILSEYDSLIKRYKSLLKKEGLSDDSFHFLAIQFLWISQTGESGDEWLYSDEEYNPNLKVDQLRNLMKNNLIFSEKTIEILKKYSQHAAEGISPKELSDFFGEEENYYNNAIWQLGKKIHQELNVPLYEAEDDEKSQYWPIIAYGKKDSALGVFRYRLREEFIEALKLFKEGKIEENDGDLYLNQEIQDDFIKLLENKSNVIVQGPPGVGKTFSIQKLINKKEKSLFYKNVTMVQFHPSYSYEDFIQGYRYKDNKLSLVDGPFLTACKEAKDNSNQNFYLVIDEINRANISKVFGELFLLIEREKRENIFINLLYSPETRFTIPKNLFIIGTMNTSDRSIAIMDYALRRRFSFINFVPGFETEAFKLYQKKVNVAKFDKTIELIKEINRNIRENELLGPNFEIGHSYFSNLSDYKITEKINSILKYEIIPFIQELFIEDKSSYEINYEKIINLINDRN